MKWNSLSYLSRRSRHMHMVGLKARQSHLQLRERHCMLGHFGERPAQHFVLRFQPVVEGVAGLAAALLEKLKGPLANILETFGDFAQDWQGSVTLFVYSVNRNLRHSAPLFSHTVVSLGAIADPLLRLLRTTKHLARQNSRYELKPSFPRESSLRLPSDHQPPQVIPRPINEMIVLADDLESLLPKLALDDRRRHLVSMFVFGRAGSPINDD